MDLVEKLQAYQFPLKKIVGRGVAIVFSQQLHFWLTYCLYLSLYNIINMISEKNAIFHITLLLKVTKIPSF